MSLNSNSPHILRTKILDEWLRVKVKGERGWEDHYVSENGGREGVSGTTPK